MSWWRAGLRGISWEGHVQISKCVLTDTTNISMVFICFQIHCLMSLEVKTTLKVVVLKWGQFGVPTGDIVKCLQTVLVAVTRDKGVPGI